MKKEKFVPLQRVGAAGGWVPFAGLGYTLQLVFDAIGAWEGFVAFNLHSHQPMSCALQLASSVL